MGTGSPHLLKRQGWADSGYVWFAANCCRQASQRQSAYCVRSSARVVESKRMVSHQHPVSCWQVKGSPQRGHFFLTAAGTDGFGNPSTIGMAKSMTHMGRSPVPGCFRAIGLTLRRFPPGWNAPDFRIILSGSVDPEEKAGSSAITGSGMTGGGARIRSLAGLKPSHYKFRARFLISARSELGSGVRRLQRMAR